MDGVGPFWIFGGERCSALAILRSTVCSKGVIIALDQVRNLIEICEEIQFKFVNEFNSNFNGIFGDILSVLHL